MDGISSIGGFAGSVSQIISLAQGQNATQLQSEVAITLLKQTLDLQKQMAAQLMQTMGVGQNLDMQA